MNEKYKKYLPSKTFALKAGGVMVLAVLVFAIFFMSSREESFSTKEENPSPLKVENQTVLELIQNDSDQDTIPDWEEALWGTNKNKKVTWGSTPDATYIETKKKELRIQQNVNVEQVKLTETEKFAREFFTSYSAMKSSGQVDNSTINNFSSALGQKIVDPNLTDRYKDGDVKINNADNMETRVKYYMDLQKLFQGYQSVGLGDELGIVSTTISADGTSVVNTADQQSKLFKIAAAYGDFAKKAMEMSVPISFKIHHLNIANSANNTGISVANMMKMAEDPIIGLSGLSQYQKYSDDLMRAVESLETALAEK